MKHLKEEKRFYICNKEEWLNEGYVYSTVN